MQETHIAVILVMRQRSLDASVCGPCPVRGGAKLISAGSVFRVLVSCPVQAGLSVCATQEEDVFSVYSRWLQSLIISVLI